MPAARRSATAHAIGKPLLDGYRPSLLDPGLYHADGQIDGEVYNYGSFLQSRMYAAGVTCSNCHEPHSLKLRAEGNAVCAPVPPAQRVRRAGAPFPRAGPAGQPVRRLPHAGQDLHGGRPAPRSRLPRAAARPRQPDRRAGCLHRAAMPARMPPGPRRGSRSGTGPNRRREPMFGEALAADRAGAARRRRSGWSSLPTIQTCTGDRPRHGGGGAGAPSGPAGLRRDPARRSPTRTRLVRLAAVGTLASARPAAARPSWSCPCSTTRSARSAWTPRGCWRRSRPSACRPTSARALDAAFAEYEAAQTTLLDRPEGLITLANFYRDRGRLAEAEAPLRDSDPPASRRSCRPTPTSPTSCASRAATTKASACCKQGLAAGTGERRAAPRPGPAADPPAEATARPWPRSGKAAQLAPDNARYAYVYAVALQETGRPGEAVAVLERAHAAAPRRSRTSCSRWPPACCSRAIVTARGATPRSWSGSRPTTRTCASCCRRSAPPAVLQRLSRRTGRADRPAAAAGTGRCAAASGAGRSRGAGWRSWRSAGAISSANTPAPRIRLPNSGSLSRPSRHWRISDRTCARAARASALRARPASAPSPRAAAGPARSRR